MVSLLLDCNANVEHRTKTGLTPLTEVGRVLLDQGADVQLLRSRGAQVDLI